MIHTLFNDTALTSDFIWRWMIAYVELAYTATKRSCPVSRHPPITHSEVPKKLTVDGTPNRILPQYALLLI
jgi:hypothetical protein